MRLPAVAQRGHQRRNREIREGFLEEVEIKLDSRGPTSFPVVLFFT